MVLDARACVAEHVLRVCASEFMLSMGPAKSVDGGSLVRGVLSKSSKTTPIPKAIVNCEFLVREDGSVLSRLEQSLTWRNTLDDRLLGRILADKTSVSKQHAEIARDKFGETRAQLAFERNRDEESKLAKDKEQHIYSEASDDEYFADELVFGGAGKIPQYIEDDADRVLNKNIEIVEAVEAAFPDDSAEMDYRETLEALYSIRDELQLNEDDLLILLSLVRLRGGESGNARLVAAVIATLQRRLTHPKYPAIGEWDQRFLAFHSLGLEGIIGRALTSIQQHPAFGSERFPRNALREVLHDNGEGLFAAECEAVVASQQQPATAQGSRLEEKKEGDVSSDRFCVLQSPENLAGLIRKVRLAFARDAYLRCSNLRDLHDHVLDIIGVKEEPGDAAESKAAHREEWEGEGEQSMSRAAVFRRLVSDPHSIVLSKQMALRILVALPSSSDSILDSSAADVIPTSRVAMSCAEALEEMLMPHNLERNLELLSRPICLHKTMALTGGSADKFNADLWMALESHMSERSGQFTISSSQFLDALSNFLGEELPSVAGQSIAAALGDEQSSDIVCGPLATMGFEYVQQVCCVLAIQEELVKEAALDSKLAEFIEDVGELKVTSIRPVENSTKGELRISVFSQEKNLQAEGVFKQSLLIDRLGTEDLFDNEQGDVNEEVAASLSQFLFLDDNKTLVLHFPL